MYILYFLPQIILPFGKVRSSSLFAYGENCARHFASCTYRQTKMSVLTVPLTAHSHI